MLLAESSVVQRLDDPAVALCVLVMVIAGIKLGGFRSTLVGFGLLLSVDAALALCGWTAEMLVKIEVPQGYATLSAFAVIFLAGVAITVGGTQAGIREYAARLRPVPDAILGGLAGILSGVVIAAAVHIGWSMATELPAEYRFQPKEVQFRVGEAMLANVSGVANSLADEMLQRYQTGLWYGPLPEPEQPEDAGDASAATGVDEAVSVGEDGEAEPTGDADRPGGFLPTLPEGGLSQPPVEYPSSAPATGSLPAGGGGSQPPAADGSDDLGSAATLPGSTTVPGSAPVPGSTTGPAGSTLPRQQP